MIPAIARSQAMPTNHRSSCGGAPILDLALCMILAVLVVGLLMLAL
ncbi:hypothetical protein AFCDBAGC_2828 [Methylobacterium cerastii]|uniref:Uncharacterized protein n=1 Tax=Methylobacterium cerastii TaxID=932741 RepID=A0ABQ4QJN3_9HYPH|nr:hypothetical protein AFCDBAGC_2828 [Methylobacterium cerastii]